MRSHTFMDGGDRTKIQAVSITGCPFPDFETKIFRSRLVETAFEICQGISSAD